MQTDRIICGDTIEEMRKLPEGNVDLIFADPPYWMRVEGEMLRVEGTVYDGCTEGWDNQFRTNTEYAAFTRAWLTECRRLLKPNGSIWVIGGMQCIYTIGAAMQELGYWLLNDVIWHKKNPTPNFLGKRLNNSHETLIWAAKSAKAKNTFHYKTAKELNTDTVEAAAYRAGLRKQMGSVWKIGVCQGNERLKDDRGQKLHATQKPEALLYRVIAISSRPGDIVLDPFGGTMTTAAVARRMGRRYIAIEREEEYCRYGARRLEQVRPEMGAIETAAADARPPKAPVKDMIERGYLLAGEAFFLQNGTVGGTLLADGRLLRDGAAIDIHAAAALAKGAKARRLNGFDHWYVRRGEALTGIREIREEYRNGENKKYEDDD